MLKKQYKKNKETKTFYVMTCEHRMYEVEAQTEKEANSYIELADLSPRNRRL